MSAFAVGAGRAEPCPGLSCAGGFALSQMPHRCPAAAGSIPEVHLAAPEALRVGDQEAEDGTLRGMGDSMRSLAVSDGGIHVYAHQRSKQAAHATHSGSEEVSEQAEDTAAPFPIGVVVVLLIVPPLLLEALMVGRFWSRGEELCCFLSFCFLPVSGFPVSHVLSQQHRVLPDTNVSPAPSSICPDCAEHTGPWAPSPALPVCPDTAVGLTLLLVNATECFRWRYFFWLSILFQLLSAYLERRTLCLGALTLRHLCCYPSAQGVHGKGPGADAPTSGRATRCRVRQCPSAFQIQLLLG